MIKNQWSTVEKMEKNQRSAVKENWKKMKGQRSEKNGKNSKVGSQRKRAKIEGPWS